MSVSVVSDTGSTPTVIIGELYVKAAQVVLGARIPQYKEVSNNLSVRRRSWFNLEFAEVESASKPLDAWRRNPNQPLVVEIFIKPWGASGEAAASSPDSGRVSATLLERWIFHHAPHSGPEQALALSRSEVARLSPSAVYKRFIVLLRSLYSYVRLLPAYRLYRAAQRQGGSAFTLSYSFSATPSSAAASPPSASPRLFRYAFADVETALGAFCVRVDARPDAGVELADRVPGLVPAGTPPRIISDYLSSPDGCGEGVEASSGCFIVEASSGRFIVEASSGRSGVEASSGCFIVEASSGRSGVEASSGCFIVEASSGRSGAEASSRAAAFLGRSVDEASSRPSAASPGLSAVHQSRGSRSSSSSLRERSLGPALAPPTLRGVGSSSLEASWPRSCSLERPGLQDLASPKLSDESPGRSGAAEPAHERLLRRTLWSSGRLSPASVGAEGGSSCPGRGAQPGPLRRPPRDPDPDPASRRCSAPVSIPGPLGAATGAAAPASPRAPRAASPSERDAGPGAAPPRSAAAHAHARSPLGPVADSADSEGLEASGGSPHMPFALTPGAQSAMLGGRAPPSSSWGALLGGAAPSSSWGALLSNAGPCSSWGALRWGTPPPWAAARSFKALPAPGEETLTPGSVDAPLGASSADSAPLALARRAPALGRRWAWGSGREERSGVGYSVSPVPEAGNALGGMELGGVGGGAGAAGARESEGVAAEDPLPFALDGWEEEGAAASPPEPLDARVGALLRTLAAAPGLDAGEGARWTLGDALCELDSVHARLSAAGAV